MLIKKFILLIYRLGRSFANVTGLAHPIRITLGPIIGKLMFRALVTSQEEYIVEEHRMVLASPGKYPPIQMAIGDYEASTTQLFRSSIKPGMTVLDIGAHVGYYTLLAAKLVEPKGKVFSFEPDQDNYRLLIRNIDLNGYENVTADNRALSNTSGSRTLFISALDNGRHSIYRQPQPELGSVIISATTADDYFGPLGWPNIDFIKMDVEGSELDALKGMTTLIERSTVLTMVMELNPNLLRNAEVMPLELLNKVMKLGFKVYRIEDELGTEELNSNESDALATKLASSGESVNLLCLKR